MSLAVGTVRSCATAVCRAVYHAVGQYSSASQLATDIAFLMFYSFSLLFLSSEIEPLSYIAESAATNGSKKFNKRFDAIVSRSFD